MFGERLKTLRMEAGLSQKALATRLFISQQAVAGWELDKGSPNPETVAKISEILDVSTDYLLGRTDQKQAPTPEGERKVEKQDLMAAFWGGDKDLSPEDMDAMWADVENFAAFVAQQKKREKQG